MKRNHFPLLLLTLSLSSCTISFPALSNSSGESSKPSESLSSQATTALDSTSESTASSSLSSEEKEENDFHPSDYSLTWSDEFEGKRLDLNTWDYEIGNGNWGWGNNELEYYTDENETVSNGMLTITAKAEETRVDDKAYQYTSSRLVSRHKQYFTYGYMCARIRLPLGTGLWPAFWMMPEENYGTDGTTWWPTPGEIDIMEAKGRIENITSGALHYSTNGTGGTHTYQTAEHNVESIADFHVYAVKWEETKISWYVDGEEFLTVASSTWSRGYKTDANKPDDYQDNAPFYRNFYFIINLAVGGNFDNGKKPDASFVSADMDIDYVRCYQVAE